MQLYEHAHTERGAVLIFETAISQFWFPSFFIKCIITLVTNADSQSSLNNSFCLEFIPFAYLLFWF